MGITSAGTGVRRIVANTPVADTAAARGFHGDLPGMAVVMDHGWIVTYAAAGGAAPQVSFATGGGSGTPVPDLSIEVDDADDADEVHRRMVQAGIRIAYGPASEPWGMRRFHIRDPFGRLLSSLSHPGAADIL